MDAILPTTLELERDGLLAAASRNMREDIQHLLRQASGCDPAERERQFEQYLAAVRGYADLFEVGYFPPAHHTVDDVSVWATARCGSVCPES